LNTGVRKSIFLLLGWTFLAIGLVGVLVPLLPTAPFVLLAAYCFSRSSQRLHTWLIDHRLFGSFIRNWEAHHVIPLKAKWTATVMMLVMTSYSLFFKELPLWVVVGVVVTVSVALIYIWSKPSGVPC